LVEKSGFKIFKVVIENKVQKNITRALKKSQNNFSKDMLNSTQNEV
jgi:hypothetical protein